MNPCPIQIKPHIGIKQIILFIGETAKPKSQDVELDGHLDKTFSTEKVRQQLQEAGVSSTGSQYFAFSFHV